MSERKPLEAAYVGNVNEDAMKALGDVTARRKWGDTRSGSPLTTNLLCAEIARLNLERAELLEVLHATTAEAIEHREDIIAARAADFLNLGAPKYQQAYQQEVARMDALIERAKGILAKATGAPA